MDPQYQQQPPQFGQQFQQPPSSGATHGASTLFSSLGSDIMAGIVYLLSLLSVVGLVLQIIVFAMEKNRYIKFHAAQAIGISVVEAILFFAYFIINIVIGVGASADQSGAVALGGGLVSLLLGCVVGLLGLACFGLWIWGMISAFTGKATKLPVIGGFAENLAGGTEGTI